MDPTTALESALPMLGHQLFHAGDVPITPARILVLVVVLAGVRGAGWGLERVLRRQSVDQEGGEPPSTVALRFLVMLASWLLGLMSGLAVADVVSLSQFWEGSWRVANFELVGIGGTPVSLATVTLVIGVIGGSYWISALLRGRIQASAKARLSDEDQLSRLAVVERLVHYLVVVVGVAIALQTVGINLSALFAAGAVFAVGLGFAMQNIAQNFVSGVIVLIERVIKPGDVLVIDGRVVRVVEMGIRSTVVRTRDDEDLIVPNGTLAQNTVANLTLLDRSLRVRVPVGVTYDSDVDQVFEVLQRVAEDHPGRAVEKPPVVQLTGFGASSIDFDVSIWVGSPWDAPLVRSALHRSIWRTLRDTGIVIAFPQVDVHFDAPALEVLRSGVPPAAPRVDAVVVAADRESAGHEPRGG